MSIMFYFLVWGAIIFVMMRFGCGAHVMGHGHRHDGATSDVSPLLGSARWAPPGKAVDPVCGMTVEPARSKSTVHDGHVVYFCSQVCREKFELSPQAYTDGVTSLTQIKEHSHEHQH